MQLPYNKNSKLIFGKYKGYELGIVFLINPSYINWCINNIDDFYVFDLAVLEEFCLVKNPENWEKRLIGKTKLFQKLDSRITFQEFFDNVYLSDRKYKLPDETLRTNELKLQNKPFKKKIINQNNILNDELIIDEEDYIITIAKDKVYVSWDDLKTFGEKNGLCDYYDNCYGCPHANKCF